MGDPPAIASIEIDCSEDEEYPSKRIVEVLERMSLVEDEKTNLDQAGIQKMLEDYRNLNPIVVTGTTHRRKKHQQERKRNNEEEEMEVNRTLEVVLRAYDGDVEIEETDDQSFHEEITDATLPQLRALVEIYKMTRRS